MPRPHSCRSATKIRECEIDLFNSSEEFVTWQKNTNRQSAGNGILLTSTALLPSTDDPTNLCMADECTTRTGNIEHDDHRRRQATQIWKTFRDSDPSPSRSLVTGMGSVPLKAKWLEINDEGIPDPRELDDERFPASETFRGGDPVLDIVDKTYIDFLLPAWNI